MSFETSIPMPKKAEPATGIFITHEQAKAVNVMIAAITVAHKQGAYSLKDSAYIYESLKCFQSDEQQASVEDEVEGKAEEVASEEAS